MSKTRTLTIAAAFTAAAVGGTAWLMSGNSNRVAPPTGPGVAPHTDTVQRNAARDDVVAAFDTMRPRLNVLEDVARKTGTMDAYRDMMRNVNQAYNSTYKLGNKDGTIIGMPETDRINVVRDIESPVRMFFAMAQNRPGFDDLLHDPYDSTKLSEVGKLYKEWPGYTASIQRSLGIAPSDLAKSERTITNSPLMKELVAITPSAGPDGTVKHSIPFQMMQSIALEMKKGGAGFYMDGVDLVGRLMAQPAPHNPLGGSDLYHALDYSQRWLKLDSNMRGEGARYDMAVANVQANYTINIKATLSRARTDVQQACTKIAAELKTKHGYRGDSKCNFDLR